MIVCEEMKKLRQMLDKKNHGMINQKSCLKVKSGQCGSADRTLNTKA